MNKGYPKELRISINEYKDILKYILAHLSRRLTGELIVYRYTVVVVVVVVVVVHTFHTSSPLKSKPNFMWSILRKGE